MTGERPHVAIRLTAERWGHGGLRLIFVAQAGERRLHYLAIPWDDSWGRELRAAWLAHAVRTLEELALLKLRREADRHGNGEV